MIDKEKFIEYLDKQTCDRVMYDVQNCLDEWSLKELDSRSAIITLTRFAVDLAFKFSDTETEALQLILSMAHDHMDIPGFESETVEEPDKTIH
tara:strand:+ start:146 stop:424 length:279 start_codon:yes stop_codon:yes gene_type:complete